MPFSKKFVEVLKNRKLFNRLGLDNDRRAGSYRGHETHNGVMRKRELVSHFFFYYPHCSSFWAVLSSTMLCSVFKRLPCLKVGTQVSRVCLQARIVRGCAIHTHSMRNKKDEKIEEYSYLYDYSFVFIYSLTTPSYFINQQAEKTIENTHPEQITVTTSNKNATQTPSILKKENNTKHSHSHPHQQTTNTKQIEEANASLHTCQVANTPQTSFYRRPLPENLIAFSSNEGI